MFLSKQGLTRSNSEDPSGEYPQTVSSSQNGGILLLSVHKACLCLVRRGVCPRVVSRGSIVWTYSRRVFAERRPRLRTLHRHTPELSPRYPSSRAALTKLLMRGAPFGASLGVEPCTAIPTLAVRGGTRRESQGLHICSY